MLIGLNITFTLFVFFLEHEIDTLQRLCLELVDDVVQDLQPSDIDHAVVIRWIWNLNSNTENSDENRGKMWALHKRVICTLKLRFTGNFLKHSKNHSDEATDDINFFHDISNEWILPSEV